MGRKKYQLRIIKGTRKKISAAGFVTEVLEVSKVNSLEKVNKWKQKLLDLGKRNRLLFFRPTKRTTLQLIDPDYTNIFRRLVNEGRPLEFIMDNQKRFDLDREEDDLEATTEEPSERVVIKSGQVLADQTGSNLEKSLYQLRSRARTAVEEQGVTILFVAFGFLEWTEVDASQEIIRSPLVMVPVELQQDSILEPYRLVPVDDDVVLNPTLVHKLELDFGIELPGLPEDGDWELDDLLDRIEEVVSKRGWRVAREVYLSLFSFLKLNMYKDLKRNAEAMVEHPLIAAIAGDTSKMSPLPDDLLNDGDLDRRIQPHDTYQVWDADSSQQEAILAAKQGVSFVLQGPPGTGKSQTITNIIAECLAAGKRVLFVSEKMAALEVVYRRLKEAGLEDFCLQLHSHKANKKEVVNELGRTLLADKIQVVCGALEQLDNLVSQREKLNAFVNALHTVRQPLGRSVYQIHGEVAKLEKAPDVIFSFEQAGSCGPSDLRRFENLLNQFAGTVRRVGSEYFANPWNGCIIPAYTLKLQHDINTRFGKLSGLLTRLEELLDDIADRLSLSRPQSLQEMERIATILALVGKSPQPPIEWLLSDTLEPLLQQASAYKESQMEWQSLRSRLLRRYKASILSVDTEALIDALTTGASRALKMFKASYISGPEGLLEQREQLMPFLRQAATAIKNMLQAGAELSRILGIEPPQTTAACRHMVTLAEEVAKDPRPVSSWFDLGQHRMILGLAKEARENFERLHSVETALFARYDREVLSLEVPSILQRFRTDYSGLFRYLKAGYYRDMKILRSYLKNPAGFTYQQALSDLQLMKEALDQRSWIANNELQMANSFGTWYLGDQTDWDALDSALLCVGEIISHFRPDTVPPNLQNLLVSSGAPVGQVAVQLENLKRALDEVTPLLKVVCEQFQMDEGVISSETIEEIALPIIQAWAEAAESALNPVFQAYDAVRAHLKGDGNLLLSEALEDLHAVNRVNTIETDLEAHLDDLRTAFGRFYRGVETEWSAVISALDWASQVRALFLPGRPPEGFARPICTDQEVIQLARDTAKTCAKLLEAAKEKASFAASLFEPGQVDLIQMQVPSVKQWLQVRLENMAALEDWIDFRQSREQCRAAGLEPFVNAVLESHVPPESIKAAFFKRFYRLWLDYIYSQVPELQEFRGRRHEEIIEDFRQLDKAQFRIAQSRLRAKLSEQRPNPYLMTARGSEVAILLGETEKRRKLKPLRKLFQEIPNLLLTLKPCLLMSPLSVSQYLDPNLYQFDTVIFDEASQICTEDAIGAIFRGRQLIVVGDREQLPPTNFFSVSVGEGEFADEDDDTEAYESILDVCSSVLHRKSLRWHYRSRHEHLIAFSNAHIYKNYNGPIKLDTKTGGPKRQMSIRKKYPTDFKAKVVLEILKEEKS
ncbi:DUF4011 domain-containing protein, partial [Neomoorella thermoacetica]|uniref:DUF4011 domain-containing protein n=1 Tax=Neomoorella thermoacetica TaxID=1525 RepID=UPI0008FA2DA6